MPRYSWHGLVAPAKRPLAQGLEPLPHSRGRYVERAEHGVHHHMPLSPTAPQIIQQLFQHCNATGLRSQIMHHEIKWSMLLSLRVQICLLSSVEFLRRVTRHRPLYFMAHYFVKLTLQQRKQEMQPMPQGKIPNYLPTRIVKA